VPAAVAHANHSLDSGARVDLSRHRICLLEQGDGDVAVDVTDAQRDGIFRRLGASLPTPRGQYSPVGYMLQADMDTPALCWTSCQ